MSNATRLRFLRVVLVVVGLIFLLGIYPLGIVWPSGWTWGQGHSHYLMMIVGLIGDVLALLIVAIALAALTPRAART
jgi:hypothetical protein